MRIQARFLVTALLVLSGCTASETSPPHSSATGQLLLVAVQSEELERAATSEDSGPVLAFYDIDHDDVSELAPLSALAGERHQLLLAATQAPSELATLSQQPGQPRYALAFFAVAKLTRPASFVRTRESLHFSCTDEPAAPCQLTTRRCSDGGECYVEERSCPEGNLDEGKEQCQLLSRSGDPALAERGTDYVELMDYEHGVLYLPDGAPAGSFFAEHLGGPLPRGYHVFELREANDETDACEEAANRAGLADYNTARGTALSSDDRDAAEGELQRELSAAESRAYAAMGCFFQDVELRRSTGEQVLSLQLEPFDS